MSPTYTLGAALDPGALVIDLGPTHPTRSGRVQVHVEVDDGLITAATIAPGIHRGAEKLFEVRDYRQILSLADRHDWQAAFAGELGAALAFERALGLTPGPRAVWVRTLLAELTRIASHLAFASAIPEALCPDAGLAAEVRGLRWRLRDHLAILSGHRVHPMIVRLGGLEVDADDAWLAETGAVGDRARAVATSVLDLLDGGGLPRDVAGIDASLVDGFGLSGPTAWAAGVGRDLRRDRPYLAYAELDVRHPEGTRGDAVERLRTWVADILCACSLVTGCLERLADITGEVSTRLPQIVRLPEVDEVTDLETPLGRAGWWLVSRGDKTPWRLRMRTPSFAAVAALEHVLVGVHVEDLPVAVASVGYVVGDLAK